MKHSDFKIGEHFYTLLAFGETCKWRCTDVGTRTIAAIRVDEVATGGGYGSEVILTEGEAQANGWFDGPPYIVREHLFDEDDFAGCAPTPEDL